MECRGKLLVVVNPISGTHSKKGLKERLGSLLSEAGFDVTAETTRYAGHASELSRKAVSDGYRGVIVCGGDGTVNEVASQLVGTDVAMGIVPCGSGNGLARHADIAADVEKAARIIDAEDIRVCDYGTVNGKPFFCTFGMGFDAAVSDRFAAAASRGKMAYIKSALHEFVNYKARNYRIVADGNELNVNAMIVAVCNANQYGNNAYIAPRASITDGLLDLVIVRDMSKLKTVLAGMELMAGTIFDNSNVLHYPVRNVTIETDSAASAHVDGEPYHFDGTTFSVECHPGKLKLFANPQKAAFRPIVTPVQSMINDIESSVRHLLK